MKKLFTFFIACIAFGMTVNAQTPIPFMENFDTWTNCTGSCNANCNLAAGFQNVTGDDGSWITDNGGTSSGSTGPAIDHTLGSSAGRYLYFETSSPCYPNRTANMWSPAMDFSLANAPQLEFWYHMLGASMGQLHLDASTDGGTTWSLDIVPSRTDNQDLWQKWDVNLSSYAGDTVIIRFRGVSTTSFTSDMAIDDVNFYDLLPNDAGVTSIDSPSTPACNLGNNVYATVTNFGTDSLASVNINWSINGTAQTPVAWTGNLQTLEDTSVFLGTGSINPGDDICVWTSMPNGVAEAPTGAPNDTSCVNVGLGLQGIFSVGGAGADYPSIGATVMDLNQKGVCGPVVFELSDSTFVEQIMFEEVIGASATNTITYRSASGDRNACRVEWGAFQSLLNYTFFMNGADHFHFQDMTVAATGPTYGRVLEFNNGADWNSYTNCILQGTPNNTTTSTFKVVIWSTPGANDNYNEFRGNRIENGSYAAYWYGSGITSLEQGTVFEDNELLNQWYYGVRLYYQDAPQLVGNDFTTNSTYTGLVYRFYMVYCDNGFLVKDNVATGDRYGYGVFLSNCDGSANAHGRIYNNMLTIGNPATTNTSYGIYATNSGYMDIAHNSVSLMSNGTNSRAMYITSGGLNNIWNNNLVVDGPGYGIYVTSAFSITAMDYNNIYAPNGNVGYFNGAQGSLSDWQTASGYDGNSVSTDPQYYDPASDLHVCNDTLNGAAFPLAFVERDIDDQPRDPSTPDIGADEFAPINGFSLGADTALCTGDTLWLVAGSPSDTILWNTGDTTSSLAVTAAGTYSVSVNGVCGSASDAITVTASNIAYTGFLMDDANVVVCDGDTVTLWSSMPADSYTWSTGDSSSSIQVTTSGTYTLGVDDACGSGSESITLSFETAPTASFTSTSSFFTGIFTNTSTGAGTLTYDWDFGDQTGTSNLQDPLYVYGDTGTYTVTLTVSNECGTNSITGSITIKGDTTTVGIADQLESGNVSVYPNPSTGAFNIGLDLNGAHKVSVSVQNLQGQEVAADEIGTVAGEFTQEMDLGNAAAGVYFVKIRVDNEFVVRKLIIE